MKKILVIFLIISSVCSFVISYYQTDKVELDKMEKAEQGIAKQFVIPNDNLLSDPDEIYPLMYEAAKETDVNIFRSSINYRKDDQIEILKYVLLVSDTHFFDGFRLNSGSLLTMKDTQQGDAFMSTVNTGDQKQIGIVKDFGSNDLITIKPLKASYEHLPVFGQYFVETAKETEFNAFINNFINKINEHFKKELKGSLYTSEDFTKNLSGIGGSSETKSWISQLNYIRYIIFAIILFLLIYHVFNESPKIGIIKMHGASNLRLWFIISGRLITTIFVLTIVVSFIAAITVKDTTYSFVINSISYQLITYIIMIALSFISYLYISKIKVSDVIKNRKDSKMIFVLNLFFKAVCSVLLVLLCISIWNQYVEIRNNQNLLKNWENSKDYGVFYPEKVGYDMEDIKNGGGILSSTINNGLYPVLNRMGALLINASMYEETSLSLNKDYVGIRSVKVNPNYLRKFPILDMNNTPVQVSEDSTDWILLVPEKYHNREDEILSFFHKDRTGAKDFEGLYEYEEHHYKTIVPDRIKNQNIRIVWLANDQKIFSFNPNVFPDENNIIIDPIIQVVTENNSLCADRDSILGGGGTDPLKIKLIGRDTALTYKTLEPELKSLKLDDNLKYLVTVDQVILQKIYNLQKSAKQFLLMSLGLMAGLLILIIQNLIVFFNKNQQKFIVRKLFGIGFFRTYKEYFLLFSTTWIFQILICIIANRAAYIKIFEIAGAIIVIELTAAAITLVSIEQRDMVKVLKGGI